MGKRNRRISYCSNKTLVWITTGTIIEADMRGKETDRDYERAVEQLEHDMLYEHTFNQDDGSI